MINPRTLGLNELEAQYGLPSGLLSAVAQTESSWNPKAVSPAGAQGLFQFMPKTAQAYGVNPFDPQSSAVGAARMYGDLLKQYDGDLNMALAGYNWGSGNIQRKGIENMPKETKDYIEKVTGLMGGVGQDTLMGGADEDAIDAEIAALEAELGTTEPQIDEADVDAEIAALEAELQQPTPPNVSRGRTVLEQGLQGATFGASDEIMNRIGAGIASVVTGEKYSDLLNEANQQTAQRMAQQMEQRPALAIGSQLGGGLLTGAAGASTKAGSALTRLAGRGLLPNAKGVIGAGANLATKAGITGAVGATQGALYGAGTAEEGKRLEGASEGAAIGGLVGGAFPVAGAAISKGAQAVVPKIEASVKPLVKQAEKFGIPLRIDQVAPTKTRNTLQKISQAIPASGVDAFEAKQVAAWNKALAKTIGIEADNLAPEVIEQFLEQSTNKFTQALGNRSVKVGKIGLQRIDKIADEASNTISDDLAEVVRKNAEFLKQNLSTGTLDAKKASSVRSQLIKRAQNAQGGAKQYLSEFVDIIDTAAARNMPKSQASALKQARKEWRNYKTIQPLLEGSVDGVVNPTQLMNRVKSSKYIRASAAKTGDDELVDLARIGKLLAKKGGSDTFEKSVLPLGSLGIGTAAYSNPVTGIAAAIGVPVSNRLFQAYNTAQPLVRAAARDTSESSLMKLGSRLGIASPKGKLTATVGTVTEPKEPTKIYINPNKNPYKE